VILPAPMLPLRVGKPRRTRRAVALKAGRVLIGKTVADEVNYVLLPRLFPNDTNSRMKRVSSAEDRHAGRPGAHASKHSARLDTDSLLLKHVLSHELDTPAGAAVHVASGHADVAAFTSIGSSFRG
jgi:hypothetical protein